MTRPSWLRYNAVADSEAQNVMSIDGNSIDVAVWVLGVLFKQFLFCVIISTKETFKNIFSWD